MIVYGSTLSPFVRKTLAFAAEKGITVESRPVNLGSTDPLFREASPFGKMPALRDGDFTLADSTAIITYFEAIRPEPVLIPAEAKARARTIWFEEFADTIMVTAFAKLFFNRLVAPRFLGQAGDDAAADKAEREELPPIMAYVERMLPESGFLIEDRLTLADVAVTSPFVNLLHVGYDVDASAYPKVAAFVARMLARPSYATMVAAERAFIARLG